MESGSLPLFDRIQFGGIAAFFGFVVGGLIALIIMVFSAGVLGELRPYNLWLVWFSGAYFFVVGVFRGAEAAETVVDGLAASALVVLGGIGIAGGGQTVDGDFGWKRSMWWSVTFFLGVALVAWLA